MLIDPAHNQLTADAWIQIYRGISHSHAPSQFQQNGTKLSADSQSFADLFCDLQNKRHNVGYNPLASFTAQTAAT